MQIRGKVALITGGARGIGYALATKFLELEAKVIICDISDNGTKAAENLQHFTKNTECYFIKCDASEEESFKDCILRTKQIFGELNILINNAAFVNDSPSHWSRSIDVNIKSVIIGCKLGLREITKGGIIINISSTTAILPYLLMPIYSMSKAAVANFTETIGSDFYYKKFNIKVIGILPGMTDTPILKEKGMKYMMEELAEYREEAVSLLGKKQPCERVVNCVMMALDKGDNGSLWVSRDNNGPELLEKKFNFIKV